MATIEIRTAKSDDVPALRDVFRRSSWSNEGDRPLLVEHPEFLEFSGESVVEGRTRVGLLDGRAVGFATIIDEGTWWELEDLFVDPDRMRLGVGLALVRDLVERACASGIRRIEVDGNEHALQFYERAGFVAGEAVQLEHGTAVRMRLEVTSERDSSTGPPH